MLKKRIIPCLDIKDGRVVKGVNFLGLADAGDPVELAARYAAEGADELVFLDITATLEKRKTLAELVRQVAATINIPFTVGGGINTAADAEYLVRSGADKVSLNSSAVKNPELINEISHNLGCQAVVVAIDAKRVSGVWEVFINGGNTATGLQVTDWAQQAEQLGAGEILLTSMDKDGTKSGFAIDLLNEVCNATSIPVIASGGAGSLVHFKDMFNHTGAGAALAASLFHYGELGIQELKDYLKQQKNTYTMKPDFNKANGLLPAIIQDALNSQVLMLGYMNEEAFRKTKADGLVTFYSRSKNRLWTKGETSGNYLNVQEIKIDCDNDTLLITVLPLGPVCHTGTQTCFGEKGSKGFLYKLEQTIADRAATDNPDSYINALLKRGINKVAQKVGEEAVELVIEAKDNNDDLFKNEAADLLFHFLILLKAKEIRLEDIETVLSRRVK